MRPLLAAIIFAIAASILPAPAQAAMFGNDETIHPIQDITLKGAKDEALFLGYKTSTLFIIAGLFVSDDGYVLGVKGDSKKYYQMPKGEKLTEFQKGGFLPDPLPPYKLGAFDYLLGYSLWIILALMALWYLVKFLRREPNDPDTSKPAAPAA